MVGICFLVKLEKETIECFVFLLIVKVTNEQSTSIHKNS